MNFEQRDQPLEEMRKEKSPMPSADKNKDLVSKLSRLSIDNNVFEGSTDLPQVFQVSFPRGLEGFESLALIFALYLLR